MSKKKIWIVVTAEILVLVLLTTAALAIFLQKKHKQDALSGTVATTQPIFTTTVPQPTTPPVTEPTLPPEPEPEVIQLTLTFTGDCTLGRNQKMDYVGTYYEFYDKYGADYFFENVRHIFQEDDLTIINLEGSLTDSEDAQPHEFLHKGRPEFVNVLSGSSVEVATMGNNHNRDYGIKGRNETIRVLQEKGIAHCFNENYAVCEVKGIKIGFVSVDGSYGQYVDNYLKNGYKSLREDGCDLVIACIHWGAGKTSVPNKDQLRLGPMAIDLGYDLVVGNHPHVLQGMQLYKGKYILYSLGNFSYGGNRNPADKDSGIFQQTFTFIDGELQAPEGKFIPCRLSGVDWRNDYQPKLVEGEEYDRIMEKVSKYSRVFGYELDSEGRLVECDPDEIPQPQPQPEPQKPTQSPETPTEPTTPPEEPTTLPEEPTTVPEEPTTVPEELNEEPTDETTTAQPEG